MTALLLLWPVSGWAAGIWAACCDRECSVDDAVGLIVIGALYGPVWLVIVGVGWQAARRCSR